MTTTATVARRLLLSCTYLGGTEPLTIGGRYLIERDQGLFRVIDATDLGATDRRISWSLRDLEITVLGDRLVVSDRSRGRALIFGRVTGPGLETLEQTPDGSPSSEP